MYSLKWCFGVVMFMRINCCAGVTLIYPFLDSSFLSSSVVIANLTTVLADDNSMSLEWKHFLKDLVTLYLVYSI